ncbi:unnamed protein product [Allacma fusca]|uniref:Uncharacterized protein n=1 Tax=Allacma fusca TaxID=39272 RepID=A0A8J2JT87_9HEXA|nr:unnamed protein product [Allacma fusca]
MRYSLFNARAQCHFEISFNEMIPCYRDKAVAWQTPLLCCVGFRTVDKGLEGSVKAPNTKPRCVPTKCRGPWCLPLPPNYCDIAPLQRPMFDECGECPIATLHRLKDQRECYSGKYYPEELDLPRVCNPRGGCSYLTASPMRCNRVYRYCEPMRSSYQGHIPFGKFLYGHNSATLTRNPLKHLTYRI